MKFINPRMTDGKDRELKAAVGSLLKYHSVPGWLRQRLGRKVRGGVWTTRVQLPGANMIVYHWGDRPEWLDHWGIVQRRGREVFISEPYGLTDEATGELMEFCRALNLDFDIDACSYHFPTQTLRITLWPREWKGEEALSEPEEAS